MAVRPQQHKFNAYNGSSRMWTIAQSEDTLRWQAFSIYPPVVHNSLSDKQAAEFIFPGINPERDLSEEICRKDRPQITTYVYDFTTDHPLAGHVRARANEYFKESLLHWHLNWAFVSRVKNYSFTRHAYRRSEIDYKGIVRFEPHEPVLITNHAWLQLRFGAYSRRYPLSRFNDRKTPDPEEIAGVLNQMGLPRDVIKIAQSYLDTNALLFHEYEERSGTFFAESPKNILKCAQSVTVEVRPLCPHVIEFVYSVLN